MRMRETPEPRGEGRGHGRLARAIALWTLALAMAASCVPLLLWLCGNVGVTPPQAAEKGRAELGPAYDMYVNNLTASALDGLLTVPKVYWLPEDLVVAPAPDPDCFGASENAEDAAEVLALAREALDMDGTFFSPERPLRPGSTVRWYLDDTIFSICWKQVIHNAVFSFAEIKIAHPSQFRRYLAENTFASPLQFKPSEMARTVNAVTAMSADFYKYRLMGTVVYQRQLYRFEGQSIDTCFINGSGELLFVPRGEIVTEEEALKFIEDNDVLFSLSFGPILIVDGELTVPQDYLLGQINDYYPRACICELGPCHYLLVAANTEQGYPTVLNLRQFAEEVQALGIQKAYTLDGGQTAAIYTDGEVFNSVDYGGERTVSDIIYFATAIPDAESYTHEQ